MIYYKGIVGHYKIVLTFHRSLGKNGKNILKGEYPKKGIKYEGGDDATRIHSTIFICL